MQYVQNFWLFNRQPCIIIIWQAVNRVYLNDVVLSAGATEVLKSGDEIRLGIKSELAEAEYFTYKYEHKMKTFLQKAWKQDNQFIEGSLF